MTTRIWKMQFSHKIQKNTQAYSHTYTRNLTWTNMYAFTNIGKQSNQCPVKFLILKQMPYDLTFDWNLIDKMNKQAKYNQRHWNWEQADSDQRGERRGEWGGKSEEFTGTIIKDTWTTTREGWKWGREAEGTGVVGRCGGEQQKTVLEQQ